jgi:hypothetical protein
MADARTCLVSMTLVLLYLGVLELCMAIDRRKKYATLLKYFFFSMDINNMVVGRKFPVHLGLVFISNESLLARI